jgi:hypothetical protein
VGDAQVVFYGLRFRYIRGGSVFAGAVLACSKALPAKPSEGFLFATFLNGRLSGENQSLSLADKVVLPPIYDPLRFAIRQPPCSPEQ